MGSYVAIKNTPISVRLDDDFIDGGWTISAGKAIHSGCNSGEIGLDVPLVAGETYVFQWSITDYKSGGANIRIGNINGPTKSANGDYEDQIFVPFTATDLALSFFSDGNLSISVFKVYDQTKTNEGTTFAFDEKANLWPAYLPYHPEFMCKFIDGFYTFRDGELWEHNVNPIRNNFYNFQYDSFITFYVNIDAEDYKDFMSIVINSNKVWTSPFKGDIKIYPTEGKPQGLVSRLRKGRFKRLNNKYYADFLRHMEDPRFNDEDVALLKGALLQGMVMEITIRNSDTEEVRLISVEVITSKHNNLY